MKRVFGIILFFTSFQSFGQLGKIDGTVIYKPDSSELPGVTLIISGTRTGTISNTEGYFVIDSLEAGTYDLTFQYIGLGLDTVRNIVVTANSTTTLNLGLPSGDCSKNKSKICPIGSKSDEVIPIVYGLPTNRTFRKAKRGKIYLGGCIVTGCDPQWYCKRHDFSF